MSSIERQPSSEPPSAPWWRFGMVWFAIAGPAIVVVAGIWTMAIAYAHADKAIVETAAAPTAAVDRAAPTAPALQARNHAATPKRRDPS